MYRFAALLAWPAIAMAAMSAGCSRNAPAAGSQDAQSAVETETASALRDFNRWVHSSPRSRLRGEAGSVQSPEEELGLDRPGELADAAERWISGTVCADYYKLSRETLAMLHKKLVDDWKVRKESSMGATNYTRELMRTWREAFNADYELRSFILECYSRREMAPVPKRLARIFDGGKEKREAAAKALAAARSGIKSLKWRLSEVERSAKAICEPPWPQQKKTDVEWLRTASGIYAFLELDLPKVSKDASALRKSLSGFANGNYGEREFQTVIQEADAICARLDALAEEMSNRGKIAQSLSSLAKGEAECGRLEAERAGIERGIAAAGPCEWTDKKTAAEWGAIREAMAKLEDRAKTASETAASLYRDLRADAVIAKKAGCVEAAKSSEKTGLLAAALFATLGRVSEKRNIASCQAGLAECSARRAAIEAEAAPLEKELAAAAPALWTDEKPVEAWREMQQPAAKLAARLAKTSDAAETLAGDAKSLLSASGGRGGIDAFVAGADALAARLAAAAKAAARRSEIVAGKIPIAGFSARLRAVARAFAGIPAARARKYARMAEMAEAERLARECVSRDFAGLDEIVRKADDLKKRAAAERPGEAAAGRKAMELAAAREEIVGEDAVQRLKRKVPSEEAHAAIDAEIVALERAAGAAGRESLEAWFSKIEADAFRLADAAEEDALAKRMDETLKSVQRLAARRGGH